MKIPEQYKVNPMPREQIKEWVLKKHYAKRMPSAILSFGLFEKGILVGVCVFGMPPCQMNNGSGIFEEMKVKTIELTRLVVNDNLPKNVLSYFVSSCLNQLEKPTCVVSFADPNNGHHGYIYQATNWHYTGLSQKGGKDKQWIYNGREYHAKTITVEWIKDFFGQYDSTKNMTYNWKKNGGEVRENTLRKFRYLYFCGNRKQVKEMKDNLLLPILNYPKGENKRYNASYEPIINQTLF